MDYAQAVFLPRRELQSLIDRLHQLGYTVVGPTIRQHAVTLGEITSVEQLPQGWTDQQEPAVYRLESTGSDRQFAFNVGPESWKKFLFPPQASIANARLDDEGWHFEAAEIDSPAYAFLGVRACDLKAIEIQDRVFLSDDYSDPLYRDTREKVLIIVVECEVTASTCFCQSMGSGPQCESGFDLAITELDDGYLIAVGSDRGTEVTEGLALQSATNQQRQNAEAQMESTISSLSKSFEADGVAELLIQNLEHPAWDAVAQRCLSCTNCTLVCPTCFCSTVDEVADLDVTRVQRIRRWDSCFNPEMSYTCGGTMRPDTRSRYRQWLTHKLSTWHDQFDTSGCVGCGRCITWCPVGIDLTEEVEKIRTLHSPNDETEP